jgi:hypothetical protein
MGDIISIPQDCGSSGEIEVKAGQIWENTDRRSKYPKLQIVEVVTVDGVGYAVVKYLDYHQMKVRLDRFKKSSRGYRLIQDAPTSTSAQAV